jgi:hypothetical protein
MAALGTVMVVENVPAAAGPEPGWAVAWKRIGVVP